MCIMYSYHQAFKNFLINTLCVLYFVLSHFVGYDGSIKFIPDILKPEKKAGL